MTKEVFSQKLKKIDKKKCIQLLVVFIYPLLLCVIICAFRKTNFFSLYAPYSKNNDSLMYYKLVEGMLEPGGIKGYFGYNETHSIIGSYAAWNPMILFPWLVMGRLFGWNSFSPIIYNVIFFSIALTLFAGLSKINIKQTACMLVALTLYPSFAVHLMNVLPEINMVSVMLLFFACIFGYNNYKKSVFLTISLVGCIFLTLCRPYFFLFFAIPTFCYARSNIKCKWLLPIVSMVVAVAGYLLTTKYMTAEYFEPLYSFPFLDYVKQGEFQQAISITYAISLDVIYRIYDSIREGFRIGATPGSQYFVAIISSVLLILASFGKKNREKVIIYSGMGGAYLCMLLSVVLFLRLIDEGARHSFAYSVVALMLLFTEEFDIWSSIRQIVVFVPLIFMIVRGAYIPTNYDIPANNVVSRDDIESMKATLEEKIPIASDAGKYDNTIIWTLTDKIDDALVITEYHSLYAVPKSMGINICMHDYLADNIDNLKSKYIAVKPGAHIEQLINERDFIEILRTDKIVIYQINY